MVTVRQLMKPCPTSCSASDAISRVAELMSTFDVSALPVIDRMGQVVGIVAASDLQQTSSAGDEHVSNVMTSVCECCEPGDLVSSLKVSGRRARLPVAEHGSLVGLILFDPVV